MRDATRKRPGCETVFGVLKVLMAGYVLWGTSSRIEAPHLAQIVGVSADDLAVALASLIDEGLVEMVAERRLVRLTRGGVRLLVTGPPRPDRLCAVEFRAAAWH